MTQEQDILIPPYHVFLCGPITGLRLDQSAEWRRQVFEQLENTNIIPIDPTRDSPDPLRKSEAERTTKTDKEWLIHGKSTVTRDRFDVGRSDLVLACFLGAKEVSLGSVGELFWADAMRKPVVLVMEDGNVHDHAMINEIAGWRFSELPIAVHQVKNILIANYGIG